MVPGVRDHANWLPRVNVFLTWTASDRWTLDGSAAGDTNGQYGGNDAVSQASPQEHMALIKHRGGQWWSRATAQAELLSCAMRCGTRSVAGHDVVRGSCRSAVAPSFLFSQLTRAEFELNASRVGRSLSKDRARSCP